MPRVLRRWRAEGRTQNHAVFERGATRAGRRKQIQPAVGQGDARRINFRCLGLEEAGRKMARWGADAKGDDGTRRARVRPLRGNVTIATGSTPLEGGEPETEATEAVASSRRAEQHAPHGVTAAAPGSRKLAKSPERGADAEGDDRARTGEPPESRGPKKEEECRCRGRRTERNKFRLRARGGIRPGRANTAASG